MTKVQLVEGRLKINNTWGISQCHLCKKSINFSRKVPEKEITGSFYFEDHIENKIYIFHRRCKKKWLSERIRQNEKSESELNNTIQ